MLMRFPHRVRPLQYSNAYASDSDMFPMQTWIIQQHIIEIFSNEKCLFSFLAYFLEAIRQRLHRRKLQADLPEGNMSTHIRTCRCLLDAVCTIIQSGCRKVTILCIVLSMCSAVLWQSVQDWKIDLNPSHIIVIDEFTKSKPKVFSLHHAHTIPYGKCSFECSSLLLGQSLPMELLERYW